MHQVLLYSKDLNCNATINRFPTINWYSRPSKPKSFEWNVVPLFQNAPTRSADFPSCPLAIYQNSQLQQAMWRISSFSEVLQQRYNNTFTVVRYISHKNTFTLNMYLCWRPEFHKMHKWWYLTTVHNYRIWWRHAYSAPTRTHSIYVLWVLVRSR